MRKILQCITLSEAGGAQQIVKAICKGLYKDNNIILAAYPEGELFSWAESVGIKSYPLPNMKRSISPINDIKTLFQLISIIKNEKPDIVHCHSWKAGVLGRIAAFLCGVKQVYFTVHGWSVLSYSNNTVKAIFILIEKILALITTKLVCVCEEDKKLGVKLKIAQDSKLYVIYNGIEDIEKMHQENIRLKYNIPVDAILLGTVARLAPQKRCFETLKILSEIMERDDIYFIYIGTGPLFDRMKEAVSDLGLNRRFILAGNQNNVPDYLRAMDIFLLLSNYEGLPVSILEAMSSGLPVIASDVGGVGDLIENGNNGYLVSNDEEEIKERITVLSSDKALRTRFGKNSRADFAKKFKASAMIADYKKLYEGKI